MFKLLDRGVFADYQWLVVKPPTVVAMPRFAATADLSVPAPTTKAVSVVRAAHVLANTALANGALVKRKLADFCIATRAKALFAINATSRIHYNK